MADQNHRAVLRGKRSLSYRHIICQREGRILDDRDSVAVSLQGFVDTLPTRSVHEAAVDQNDVLHIGMRARLYHENLPERSYVSQGSLRKRFPRTCEKPLFDSSRGALNVSQPLSAIISTCLAQL